VIRTLAFRPFSTLVLTALVATGCPDSGEDDPITDARPTVRRDAGFPTDTGTTPTDSGLPADSGVDPIDTGTADTGVDPVDTGTADTGADPADTGVDPADTGMDPADTGLDPADTGVDPADTGVDPADTGVDPADTGVDPVDGGVVTTDAGTVDTGVVTTDASTVDTGVVTTDAGTVDTGVVTTDAGPPDTGVNNPPVANNDDVATDVGVALTFDPRDNDTDADNDSLTITAVGTPSNGTAVITMNGDLLYTPASGFIGNDSFTYTISDGNGGTANGTISMTVRPTNNAPTATADTADAHDATPVDIDVLANDSDPDNDSLSVSAVTTSANAAATVNTNQTVRYTANAGFFGTDTFTYEMSDGRGGTDTATVTVSVNGRPTAADDAVDTRQDVAVDIDVLTNDSDPEGQTITLTSVGTTPNATVSITASSSVLYTPSSGYGGTDTFTYTITDTAGATATATVTVRVNAAPVANDDTATTGQDRAIEIDVLGNDTDLENDLLGISSAASGSNGAVSITATGLVRYTPSTGFVGSDTFSYTVNDIAGNSASAQVTVTVDGLPIAIDDSATTLIDTAVQIDVLGNDSDPENGSLTIAVVGQPPAGTATQNANGTITYTPDSGFNGTDRFEYTIQDDFGQTASATVTVSINALPVANADDAVAQEDTALDIDVAGNDTDPDNDPLDVTAVTQPLNGTASINADGTVRYTPSTGFRGNDGFTYTISDGRGGTAIGDVDVQVNGAPDAVDDSASTQEDTAVDINVLGNDTDPENATLTIVGTTDPNNGGLTQNVSGTITYTPNNAFRGNDAFTYTVSDGNGGEDTATVTVSVNGTPTAVGDGVVTQVDTLVDIDVLANDTDPENQTLTVASVGTPSNGTATINGDGTVRYTPTTSFIGDDTFTYTVEDSAGGTDDGTVTVSVNAPPVATDDTALTQVGESVDIDVVTNDSDVDNDNLSVSAVGTPSNGTAVDLANGSIRYQPSAGFSGEDRFTYEVSDGRGATSEGEVVVTVNAAPDGVDDTSVTLEDLAVEIAVLTNDTDAENATLEVTVVTQPANGTAAINADNTVTYTPDQGFAGNDAFTYTVFDGSGGTDVANVTVEVRTRPAWNPPVDLRTGYAIPYYAGIGDLNGDGMDDVVVPNWWEQTVSIFRNDTVPGGSEPSFAKPDAFAVGFTPIAVAIADMNNDGMPDVISVLQRANAFSVMVSDTQQGTDEISFPSRSSFIVGTEPRAVATGDFNGDGLPDVAVANTDSNSVSVLLNETATGTTTIEFSADLQFATGTDPYAVAVGDIDGDTLPDIVVANLNSASVSVLINTTANLATTPSFAAPANFTVGLGPTGVALSDLDNDNDLDIVTSDFADDTTTVLFNSTTTPGTPSFAVAQPFAAGDQPLWVDVGDANGDGRDDIVVVNFNEDDLSVLLNDTANAGTPDFGGATDFAVGEDPRWAGFIDLNGDTRDDLVVVEQTPETMSAMINESVINAQTPAFGGLATFNSGIARPMDVIAVDADSDGLIDLGVINFWDNVADIFLNTSANGTMSFADKQRFSLGRSARRVASGDFNEDGRPDFVVTNEDESFVEVTLNLTPPGDTTLVFSDRLQIPVGESPWHVVVGDIDGDDVDDLVATSRRSDTISIMINETVATATTATFAQVIELSTGQRPRGIVLVDINADNRLDLAVANRTDGNVSFFMNTTVGGSVSFASRVSIATGDGAFGIDAGDFNADGSEDIVVTNIDADTIGVLINTTAQGAGAPTFSGPATYAVGVDPVEVVAGDLNGDGMDDVVVANSEGNSLSVMVNLTEANANTGVFTVSETLGTGTFPIGLVITDIDGELAPEIATVCLEDEIMQVFEGQ